MLTPPTIPVRHRISPTTTREPPWPPPETRWPGTKEENENTRHRRACGLGSQARSACEGAVGKPEHDRRGGHRGGHHKNAPVVLDGSAACPRRGGRLGAAATVVAVRMGGPVVAISAGRPSPGCPCAGSAGRSPQAHPRREPSPARGPRTRRSRQHRARSPGRSC